LSACGKEKKRKKKKVKEKKEGGQNLKVSCKEVQNDAKGRI